MPAFSNFDFVKPLSPKLAALGKRAEDYFTDDPNTCLIKLRQLVERMVDEVVKVEGVYVGHKSHLLERIHSLEDAGRLPKYPAGLIHNIRRAGNDAVHGTANQHREAAEQLKNTRRLLIWYVGTYGDPDTKCPRFQMPKPPKGATDELKAMLHHQEYLTQQLESSKEQQDEYRSLIEQQALKLGRPQVVIRDSLLKFYASLPEALRAVLKPKLVAFREDPSRFEPSTLGSAVDDKMFWVVLHEETVLVGARAPDGSVLVCLWIGPCEDAEAWAARKKVEIHPGLGVLQVYDITPTLEEAPAPKTVAGFLELVSNEDLAQCGVPALLVPAVRALPDATALPALAKFLPEGAAEALFALAAGASVEEVRREGGLVTPSAPVDTGDFGAALGHAATKQHFIPVDDSDVFEAMLDAPMEKWRSFLHPSQRKTVQVSANGPVRVLGGAGTGKTVALLHRAVHLLREVFSDDATLLVTTHTSNLAGDLRAQLARMLSADEFRRVEVTHLRKKAYDLLRAHGIHPVILQGKAQEELMARAVQEAAPTVDQPLAFYLEEWDRVIQAQGIADKRGYFRASRRGRGTPLRRTHRAQVWRVFEAYRKLMDARRHMEWPDVVRRARELLEDHPEMVAYRAVLSDEIQDFSTEDLRLLRALTPPRPDDMFLVGDAHQRIYDLGATLGSCGINVRGRSYRLKINYRTTERIRRLAVSVLEGVVFDDLDGGQDNLDGYHSLRVGDEPRYALAASGSAEQELVVEQIQRWCADGAPEDICITARARWILKPFNEALQAAGLQTVYVGTEAVDELAGGVRLATMHRLKGTEFKRLLICGVQDGLVPLQRVADKLADDASREDFIKQERCLLYVAATRARDELVITGHGAPSPWFARS